MTDSVKQHSALLCIDMQILGCTREHSSLKHHGAVDFPTDATEQFLNVLNSTVVPNIARLQQQFRAQGLEVIHTRIQSLTRDGRDRSLEHKKLGIHAPPGSNLSEFLQELKPHPNEIVINKTASGVFISTNIEYVLRNIGIERVYICGVYTNECISSAVRSASDLGFEVGLLSDATAAITSELHEATLLIVDGRYGRVLTTEEAINEL